MFARTIRLVRVCVCTDLYEFFLVITSYLLSTEKCPIYDTRLGAPGALAHLLQRLQNLTTKNQNGARKNIHIFESNAPPLLKLGVYLVHMCTKGWNFLDPAKFRDQSDAMQQPFY